MSQIDKPTAPTAVANSAPRDAKFTDTPEGAADLKRLGAAYVAMCEFEESRLPRFSTIRAGCVAEYVLMWPGYADTLAPQLADNAGDDPRFQGWNSTSVGNLCLIEAFAIDPELRQRCTALRERYYQWTLTPARPTLAQPRALAVELCAIL